MRRKRLADWLEKMSAAFIVGSFIAAKGSFGVFVLGVICFALSMSLTNKDG